MRISKKKKITEIAFWLTLTLLMVIALLLPVLDNNKTYFYTTFLLQMYLVFSWVIYDAGERRETLSYLSKLALILFGAFYVFVYVFRTRGLIKGLKAIAVFMIKLVLLILLVIGGLTGLSYLIYPI